jgi:hypothetical protein
MGFTVISNGFKDGDYLPNEGAPPRISRVFTRAGVVVRVGHRR